MNKIALLSLSLILATVAGLGSCINPPEETFQPSPPSEYTPSITDTEPEVETEPEPPPLVQNPRYIYENGAIVVGGDGEPIELINNSNAINPTYVELMTFIKKDSTDEHRYVDNVDVYIGAAEVPYVCSDFAEDVHNNAEAAGIRAAWVSIDFYETLEGHALNAFETTDRGIVYIDCTGESLVGQLGSLSYNPTSLDAVAYVEIGKEYGVIDIAKAGSLSYSFYEESKQNCENFDHLLSEYNDEVIQFNQEVNEYEKLLNDYNDEVAEYNREYSEYKRALEAAGPPSLGSRWRQPWLELAEVIEFQFLIQYGRGFEAERKYLEEQGSTLKEWAEELKAWEIRLGEKEQVIDELAEELGDSWFEPLGIVEDIYIHWGNS